MSFALDWDAYLARIGYEGPLEPSIGVLARLSLAHLRTVPFENLEIVPLARAIRLEPAALVDEVVRRRGGFCFELNGSPVPAQPWEGDAAAVPPPTETRTPNPELGGLVDIAAPRRRPDTGGSNDRGTTNHLP